MLTYNTRRLSWYMRNHFGIKYDSIRIIFYFSFSFDFLQHVYFRLDFGDVHEIILASEKKERKHLQAHFNSVLFHVNRRKICGFSLEYYSKNKFVDDSIQINQWKKCTRQTTENKRLRTHWKYEVWTLATAYVCVNVYVYSCMFTICHRQ